MSSETTNEAISRSAARLRWGVLAAMAIMALLYAAARFGIQIGSAHVEYRSHGPDPGATKLIGDLTLVLLLLALSRLTQMLGRIAAGELFSTAVVSRFRAFAFWLLLMAVFSLAAPTVAQLLDLSRGATHRIEARLDISEVMTVGVTLVLFLLARLLERARRIDEEMREFV